MSRKIRPDGRKHQIPRCMYDFFGDLEALADVNAVKGGRFIHRGRAKSFDARIQHYQHYNNSGGNLRVRVQYRHFIAYFNIEVINGSARDVADYIQKYKTNGYHSGNVQSGNGDGKD